MPEFPEDVDLRVFPRSAALAEGVAREVVEFLRGHQDDASFEEPLEVAISGGFTTSALLPTLLAFSEGLEWSRVRFWWVDERFVPAGHADRNDEEAISTVLSKLPGVQWVSMPCDEGQGLEEARYAYEAQWYSAMGGRSLDLTLLGMGPDGHVASLFPGDFWFELGQDSPAVVAIDNSPKPPPQRLSLSMPIIQASGRIILATGGESKAEAIGQIFSGTSPVLYPAAALFDECCVSKVGVYLDASAASLLSI